MSESRNYPTVIADVLLDTGDTSKDLVAAPGTAATALLTDSVNNLQLLLKKITYISQTAAAQAIVVQALASGAILLSLPASVTAGVINTVDYGYLPLGAGRKITATPAAAGPAMRFIVEYAIGLA